jgi:hypothetical protein
MLPGGIYYIGDLCYVMHDEWSEVCDLIFSGQTCLEGEFQLADGRVFAIYSTKYGDGLYQDNLGHNYSVDAGVIGCIRVSDIMPAAENNTRGGQVHEFKTEVKSYSDGEGRIYFNEVIIETGDYEYEEEDY